MFTLGLVRRSKDLLRFLPSDNGYPNRPRRRSRPRSRFLSVRQNTTGLAGPFVHRLLNVIPFLAWGRPLIEDDDENEDEND